MQNGEFGDVLFIWMSTCSYVCLFYVWFSTCSSESPPLSGSEVGVQNGECGNVGIEQHAEFEFTVTAEQCLEKTKELVNRKWTMYCTDVVTNTPLWQICGKHYIGQLHEPFRVVDWLHRKLKATIITPKSYRINLSTFWRCHASIPGFLSQLNWYFIEMKFVLWASS